MSLFGDFQNAWLKRFPGCDLPLAWEEDVRANLAKHGQRVAELKEELEKEAFYVEYLERLLADVESHRRSLVDKIVCENHEENRAKIDNNDQVEETFEFESQNGGTTKSPQSANEDVKSAEENPVENVPSSPSPVHDQVSAINNEEKSNLNNVNQECFSDEDNETDDNKGKPFVTVIEVNGYDGLKKQAENQKKSNVQPKDSVDEDEDEDDSGKSPVNNNSSPAIKKKVPPKPPPKRPRRPMSTQPGKLPVDIGEKSVYANILPRPSQSYAPLVSKEDPGPNAEGPDGTEEVKVGLKPKLIPRLLKSDSLKSAGSDPESREGEEGENHLSRRQRLAKMGGGQSTDNPDSEGEAYLTVSSDKSSEYDDQTLKSQASVQSGYSSHSGGLSDGDRSGLTESPASALMDEGQSADDDDAAGDESPKYSDYVNIDYYLRKRARSKQRMLSRGESVNMDSDEDDDGMNSFIHSLVQMKLEKERKSERELDKEPGIHKGPVLADDVFDGDSGVYSSSVESTSFLAPSAHPVDSGKRSQSLATNPLEVSDAVPADDAGETERMRTVRCIVENILESETSYLDCLSVLDQYRKALQSTIGTSQFVISQSDLSTIFHKIGDLQRIHRDFFEGIRNSIKQSDENLIIGDHFKALASEVRVYAAYLKNYPLAIEAVRKCSAENATFSDITKSIKLKAIPQTVRLEDLLHEPVARVQKNALVLHDLLKYTLESQSDYQSLQKALRMTQSFLNEFNISATESMFPSHDRSKRILVRNSFIIELSEGRRKLRHLFLFTDVIICAKYRVSGRDKFSYDAKWFIPLHDAVVHLEEDESNEVRELSPVSVLSLKSQVSSVRDLIMQDEYASRGKSRPGGRNMDKHRKKLIELQAQLMLASPTLVFRIGQKNGKTYTFFLSSEFERSQWVETIHVMQASAPATLPNVTLYELHSWITGHHKFLQTNMGSFLLRTGKEDVSVGDLYVQIHSLHGLTKPADIFFRMEVDSYGHFFCKASTKVSNNGVWNQEFNMELEGSQILRILCYEQVPGEDQILLRGKTMIDLPKREATNRTLEKEASLHELTLRLSLRVSVCDMSIKRVPSAKPCGMFGMKLSTVLKKEKRDIPFLISCCVREVEKRGLHELGIYRVSGSASDLQKIRKSFESNPYEAQQLLKEVDVHSVTGILKLYLRELPEGLFTDELYPKFIGFCNVTDPEAREKELLNLFNALPQANKKIVIYLIDHMVKIIKEEVENKMSLQNVATVFGPTLLRLSAKSESGSMSDKLAAGTIDVMTQARILHFFLKKHMQGESLEFAATAEDAPAAFTR